MEDDVSEEKTLEIVRIGGYIVLGGALLGFSIGTYALFDRTLFSLFINVSQYEATGFFISFFMPSFVVIVALGYVFATASRLKTTNLWHVTTFSILSLLCLSLSVLSIFNILSFIGGFLVLTAVLHAYTKSTFKALSRKEACFLVEVGTMLVASFSTLFLLMGVASELFQTYSTGLYQVSAQYLYSLLIVEILSFLMFFTIPRLCSQGGNTWFCGALALAASIVSLLIVTRNQYYFFNASAYVGTFMMGAGMVMTVAGALTYIKLFFSETIPPAALTPSFLYRGSYCPYCGERRATMVQTSCLRCERSLMWKPGAPFCPSCGRLVSNGVLTCPHCQEDLWRKLVASSLKDLEEETIAHDLALKSKRKEMWIVKGMLKLLRGVQQGISGAKSIANVIRERLDLTFKGFLYIGILTCLFTFISFIGFVRTEPTDVFGWYALYYGFPLEWLEVRAAVPTSSRTRPRILWFMLGLDIAIYFFLSLFLVYAFNRLRR